MNLDLSDEAQRYGRTALAALEPAHDGTLAPRGADDPGRHDTVDAILQELGAWELEPYANRDDLEAAAALCRSAGYWSVPMPVAGRLSRPQELDGAGLVVVGRGPSFGVLDARGRWMAVDLDGRRSWAAPRGSSGPARRSGLADRLDLRPIDEAGGDGLVLALVLGSWGILGMLDRALLLTRTHVLERAQFGQLLAAFQGVQFQVTEAEVERSGLEELAKYTLWSIATSAEEALVDALALRLAALEAADVVFRVAHQLHGASGFCDETELSWLSRHSQLHRRFPFGPSTTREELTRRIGRSGLTGIFGPDEVPYPF
jgi:3-oxo-4-pregnene-20-carboxyl-CoA dehydrogenase alpha subunit